MNPIIVTGEPRSGTSMMMRMLEAGGQLLAADQEINVNGRINLLNFRMISVSGTATVVFTLDNSARSGGIV